MEINDNEIVGFHKATDPAKEKPVKMFSTSDVTYGEMATLKMIADAHIYYYLYKKVSWIRSCVDVITRSAVKAGYSIVPRYKDSEFDAIQFYRKRKVKVLDYLLDNINPDYDIEHLQDLITKSILINGAGYAKVLRKFGDNTPVGLEYIDFRTIAPVYNNQGRVEKYKVVVLNNGTRVEKYYNKDDIIAWRLPNPGNRQVNLSPLESLDLPISTDISALKFNEAFFRNHAQAGMILSGENLSKAEAEKNKEWIRDEYSKPENAHKPMFLLGNIKLVSEGRKSPADMSFIELRQFNREEIAGVYGVPLTKLGITEQSNRGNTEINDESFLEDTVEPIQKIFWNTFNRDFLRNKLGIREIEISYGQREKISISKTTIASKMVEAGATGNEARAVLGLPPKEGYDTPLFLKSIVPGITDDYHEKLMSGEELIETPSQVNQMKGQSKRPNQTSKE